MRYEHYVEPPLTLDQHRLTHSPRDGLRTSIVNPHFVVTGESGATFHMMRSFGQPQQNQVLNFGIYRGQDSLGQPGVLAVPFTELPAVEPFGYAEDKDSVIYSGARHTVRLGTEEFSWTDAGGRIAITARLLGRPGTFSIPGQPEHRHPVTSRSHLGIATGTIDSEPVRGIWMHDHIYSPPGVTFNETHFVRNAHNYWINWLVEYSDGSFEGGHSWRGRPGSGFTPSHHYVDGVSQSRTDTRLDVEHDHDGVVRAITLRLGDDVTVEFHQKGSFDRPIHSYGTAVSTSRDKEILRSWNYTEYFPLNWGDIEDFQAAYRTLVGRYPSLSKILGAARVRDNRFVLDSLPAI